MTQAVTQAQPGTPLHLVELGLGTPLDTFVVDKLERLAARGLRVTAAVAPGRHETLPQLNDVEVLPHPHWAERSSTRATGIALDAARLTGRHPRRLHDAVRAAHRSARPGRLARRLRAYLALADTGCDVVHFEWGSAAITYQPLVQTWGRPHVISCHGSEVNIRARRRGGEQFAQALGRALAGASAVHCVSDAVAANARELGADPDKTWVIRPGIDVDAIGPIEHKPRCDHLRIVCVGRLRELKGHEYAIRALRLLNDEGVPATLTVIGGDPPPALAEPSQRARLTGLVEQLGLTEKVQLTGALPHAKVISRLQAADVLLHPSVSEGWGVAVTEAMACGLPVVVAGYPAAREMVADGETGLLVAPRAPHAAAAALRVLHHDRALGRRLGSAAREHAMAHFGAGRETDQFIRLYRDVVNRAPSLRDGSAQQSKAPRRLGPASGATGAERVTEPAA